MVSTILSPSESKLGALSSASLSLWRAESSSSATTYFLPFSIARQTFSGVIGMSRCVTPQGESASITAFAVAGVEPMVAASPMPLAPSGLIGVVVWCGGFEHREESARGTA